MVEQDIKDFLDKQDDLRDEINKNVDFVLSNVKIDALLKNPRQAFAKIALDIVSRNSKAFKQSTKNGEELKCK